MRRSEKLIRNPIALAIIALISISGGIYAYIITEERERKIENGFSATACADSSKKIISTLRKISSDKDVDNYLTLAKGLTNKINFTVGGVPNNKAVTVIDTLESHPEIVQIYINWGYTNGSHPSNQYMWIWEGFICK